MSGILRSIVLCFLTAILLSFSLAFAQINSTENDDISFTEEEREWIRNNPTITVTNQTDWAPFDYVADGEPEGFSVDYIELVASKIGLDIEFINGYSWSELVEKIRTQEIDVIHSLVFSDDRQEYMSFTEPYIEMPVVYFGREGSKSIQTENDLSDLRIGVADSTAQARFFKQRFPNYTFVVRESTFDLIYGLINNEIDVFLGRAPIVNHMLEENGIDGVVGLGRQNFQDLDNMFKMRLATHRSNRILSAILEKGMAAVSDQEYLELSEKWNTGFLANAGNELTQEELNWLAENPVIRVAAAPTTRPIEFLSENGQISGMSGDYLELLSRILKVEFVWAGNETWGQGYDMAVADEADMMSFIIDNAERREHFDFTNGYLSGFFVIFAKDGTETIGSLEGLIGKKVAQMNNSAIRANILRDYPGIEVVDVDSTIEALNLLENEDVDAHVAILPIASYYIATENFDNIRVVGQTQYDITYSMGIRNNKPLLSSAIIKAMNSISSADEIDISRRWLTTTINEELDYTLIWQVLVAGVVVLLLVLIWAMSLRREVQRREVVEKELIMARELAWEMQSQAEEANEAKTTFLANMSHEIRTPLNAIIGFSDVMASGVVGEVKIPKHKEYLEDIKNSGDHLATVINDILDLSKIEAGKWQLIEREFSLNDCLDSAIAIVKTLAQQKQISLRCICSDQIIVYGEENSFKRALINLLSNAVKFTKEHGKIDVILEKNDKGVTLTVKDNGIGIPEDKIEKVLKPFEQNSEFNTTSEGGTGLGLPIVKQLMELHDCTFKLESDVGVGTSAIISIPNARMR